MGNLLQFVWFKDLDSWGIKDILKNNLFTTRYKQAKLADFLVDLTKQRGIIIDDDTEYEEPTISSKTNIISIRKKALGKDFKVKKRVQIKKGDLVFAKLHTQNGLFAFSDNNFVSTSTFIPCSFDNTKIDKGYLFVALKRFLRYLSSNDSVGRETYKVVDILNLKIPLPPLEIQQQLVKNYQDKLSLAQEQEQLAQQKETEIEAYLYEALGIELPKIDQQNNSILQFVRFKGLDRWDVNFLLNKNRVTSRYDVYTIYSVIDSFLKDKEGKSLRFNSKTQPNKNFNYIGMENIEKNTGELLRFQNVKGVDIRSQTIILPKKFFLYGKLRPYLNKYFYNDYKNANIITSSEFFVFSIKGVNQLYFKFCLSSSFIQHQIVNHMKGARMPRISEIAFKNLQIPLPPLAIQAEIANHIQTIKDEITTLKQQAKQNKDSALSEFEAEIFNAP